MKIICISGKAENGKTYTANILKHKLEDMGNSVCITSYAGLLKYIAEKFYGWNGNKDIEGRTLLQNLGSAARDTDVDYWVNRLIDILDIIKNDFDYCLIDDVRYENEIRILSDKYDTISLRINRILYENHLTEEQRMHESEVALDNYAFDYEIANLGDNSLSLDLDNFITWLGDRHYE